MTKLYIANTTKQAFNFEYRIPETGRMHYRTIPMGQQLMVLEATSSEIGMVIDHFARYGLTDASKIDQAAFVGLCYSIDKPVKQSVMVKALKDNDNHLDRANHERRKVQLASTEKQLRQRAQDTGNGYRGDLEVEITEQQGPDRSKELLNETLATENPQTAKPKGRARK